MIFLERTIDIKKGVGSIDEPVILYKGDKNVEVQFIIKNNPFKSKKNLTPTYGQLVIDREATSIFSTVSNLSNGKVIFVITGDMIDELVEVGEYAFQIRLFNEEQTSRVTLPVINGGIIIKQPICDGEESVANINKATVNDAIIPYSEPESVFNQDGNYNKTIWADGDLITDSKLNKVEDALDYLVTESKTHVTNEELNEALKDVDVDLSGYATEQYVQDAISGIQTGDYALKSDLNDKADKNHTHDEYLTEHQDISHLAAKNEIPTVPTNISAFTNDAGYLTQHQSLEDYALKTDIPSIDGLATTAYVDSEVSKKADENHIHDEYLTTIPSEYITESELNEQGFLTEHQSLEGYATEQYVQNAIQGIETGDVDLSDYALKTDLNNLVTKERADELEEAIADLNTEVNNFSNALGDIDSILDAINGEVL